MIFLSFIFLSFISELLKKNIFIIYNILNTGNFSNHSDKKAVRQLTYCAGNVMSHPNGEAVR